MDYLTSCRLVPDLQTWYKYTNTKMCKIFEINSFLRINFQEKIFTYVFVTFSYSFWKNLSETDESSFTQSLCSRKIDPTIWDGFSITYTLYWNSKSKKSETLSGNMLTDIDIRQWKLFHQGKLNNFQTPGNLEFDN